MTQYDHGNWEYQYCDDHKYTQKGNFSLFYF